MLRAEQLKSTAALSEWAAANGVRRAELERVYQGLEGGDTVRAQAGDLQEPEVLLPDLECSAWHDPARFPWVAHLESNYHGIRREFEREHAARKMVTHAESAELAERGQWSTYRFYHMGEVYQDHLSACPTVARVLTEVPGSDAAGMSYFSVLAKHTKVKPHCGFLNARIRCHLGLDVPPDCWMRVGRERRTWQEGKCLVFDDSFEHEVGNDADRGRAVLLVDSWHPDLSVTERLAMGFLMRLWRSYVD